MHFFSPPSFFLMSGLSFLFSLDFVKDDFTPRRGGKTARATKSRRCGFQSETLHPSRPITPPLFSSKKRKKQREISSPSTAQWTPCCLHPTGFNCSLPRSLTSKGVLPSSATSPLFSPRRCFEGFFSSYPSLFSI